MCVVLGIPGAGHYRVGGDPHAQSAARTARWASYLRSAPGLRSLHVDLAVVGYGHRLYEGLPVRHDGTGDDPLAALTPGAEALARQWLAALDLPDARPHGQVTLPLHHAVAALARRGGLDGTLAAWLVARVFTDADLYLDPLGAARRAAACDEVASALARHRPKVVLAHCFGAVVVYETLHAHPGVEVECLITVGAPLAVPGAVFERLQPAPVDGAGARPPGVRRWVNVSDVGDPFTVLRPNGAYFLGMDADHVGPVGTLGFHRARAYLRSVDVARELRPFLTPAPTG
jgi:hypothetical protein